MSFLLPLQGLALEASLFRQRAQYSRIRRGFYLVRPPSYGLLLWLVRIRVSTAGPGARAQRVGGGTRSVPSLVPRPPPGEIAAQAHLQASVVPRVCALSPSSHLIRFLLRTLHVLPIINCLFQNCRNEYFPSAKDECPHRGEMPGQNGHQSPGPPTVLISCLFFFFLI